MTTKDDEVVKLLCTKYPPKKLDTWEQNNPQDQFVALIASILGWSLNVQEFSSDLLTINRGEAIQKQAEELLKLKPWLKDKW